MAEQQTTENLRQTLFECIDEVKSGKMHPQEAKAVVMLSDKIIQTARLELEYADTVNRLDKDDQNISPGPLLLTKKSDA